MFLVSSYHRLHPFLLHLFSLASFWSLFPFLLDSIIWLPYLASSSSSLFYPVVYFISCFHFPFLFFLRARTRPGRWPDGRSARRGAGWAWRAGRARAAHAPLDPPRTAAQRKQKSKKKKNQKINGRKRKRRG